MLQGVTDLVMIFRAAAVPLVRTAKLSDTSDIDLWPYAVVGPQDSSAACDLEPEITNGPPAYSGNERSDNSLISDETAATRTRIDKTARIERARGFTIIRECVTHHQRVQSCDLMVEFAGCLRFG